VLEHHAKEAVLNATHIINTSADLKESNLLTSHWEGTGLNTIIGTKAFQNLEFKDCFGESVR